MKSSIYLGPGEHTEGTIRMTQDGDVIVLGISELEDFIARLKGYLPNQGDEQHEI